MAKYKSILAKYKGILSMSKSALSKHKRILSKYTSILAKYKIILLMSEGALSKYKSILSKYKSILSKSSTEKLRNPGNGISGTRNLLSTSGSRNPFPEPITSKHREQNLTPRNPSNTETFETSGSQPSEPGTMPQVRNPVPSRNRPSSPRTHQNLYCAKTP